MSESTRERILSAARLTAQARGYGGLNFRDLAEEVGIRAASIHYYFPGKAALGAAVAGRYREDAAAALETMADEFPDPLDCLRRYPDTFRAALQNDNRMCLASMMAAEHDDLPEEVRAEVRAFAEVNVAWIGRRLSAASLVTVEDSTPRAWAIFAAIVGAQLLARSRSDIAVYDSAIDTYRKVGLLPD